MQENIKKGGISVSTEHIFPIIKRWLYSDKEIFLRELVTNACDAITKLKRLSSLNKININEENYRITVTLDTSLKTLTVSDNGIGMSSDEIDKFINQIALSGALEFIKTYEGENGGDGIIGHFGLGFYSAFMVASKVEISSKSFDENEAAAFWSCNDAGEFEMSAGSKSSRGSDITLYITDEEKEFLEEARIENILKKYCAFLPYEIYFEVVGKDKSEKPVNNVSPLWQKSASEISEEEYDEFYKDVFNDFRKPLFNIHINADYPLNFKGILYFPPMNNNFDSLESHIKLFYNQVFVSDNIKEIVPDFLICFKGVLDCPELPLNVSRSFLQNGSYVSKLSAHIVKKVADKITSLFNTEREKYEAFWTDLSPFVKYGSLKDRKFYDRVKNAILYKTTDGELLTLEEYFGENGNEEKTVFYSTDPQKQINYISLLKEQNEKVVVLDTVIDPQFISFLESINEKTKFVRVDGDLSSLKNENEDEVSESTALSKLFFGVVSEGTEISFASLKNETTPALLTVSENERRFSDMMKMYGKDMAMPTKETLVINNACPLIKKLSALSESSPEKAKKLANQIYMLALISQRSLSADELQKYVRETVDILSDM